MSYSYQKILIIQTAFLGDAILATSVVEEIHHSLPEAKIYLLVKKGNEDIFKEHPYLMVWTHDKSNKYISLFRLIKKIRKEKFDAVINLHRYLSSNILTILSGAKFKSGFESLFTFLFNHHIKHRFEKNLHEIHRYHEITMPLTHASKVFLPKLYPIEKLPNNFSPQTKYVCIFPGSVWSTKQLPPEQWIKLIRKFSADMEIYLCGSSGEYKLCEYILVKCERNNIFNIAGKYSLSDTIRIIQHSQRIYCNDSAPLHMASALNIPTTAFFCSTVRDFGFYPLSKNSEVIEVSNLSCRPCGVHGYKECPRHHFECGLNIDVDKATIF